MVGNNSNNNNLCIIPVYVHTEFRIAGGKRRMGSRRAENGAKEEGSMYYMYVCMLRVEKYRRRVVEAEVDVCCCYR